MNQFSVRRAWLFPAVALLLCCGVLRAYADTPVVRAVLFYSPSCGHCHQVITQDLPPLFEKYGDRLQIIGVNTAEAGGGALFDAACDMCGLSVEYRGVPLLVLADTCLIGSVDIPTQLPGLVERYMAEGGADWPAIPGLAEALAQSEAASTPTPAPTVAAIAPALPATPTAVPTIAPSATQPAPTPTPGLLAVGGTSEGLSARFGRDPVGNTLSVIVLAGMLAALAWTAAQRPWRVLRRTIGAGRRSDGQSAPGRMDWLVTLLCVAGLAVAGYLAYVETLQVQAVCGPVGDCNTVQQSAYARLFGLIPIGVLGVIGYVAILATWTISRLVSGWVGRWAGLAAWGLAAFGVLFSSYLTFLEPFVIGATCAWCLSSAVIMTLLLLLLTMRVIGARLWAAERGEVQGARRPA